MLNASILNIFVKLFLRLPSLPALLNVAGKDSVDGSESGFVGVDAGNDVVLGQVIQVAPHVGDSCEVLHKTRDVGTDQIARGQFACVRELRFLMGQSMEVVFAEEVAKSIGYECLTPSCLLSFLYRTVEAFVDSAIWLCLLYVLAHIPGHSLVS